MSEMTYDRQLLIPDWDQDKLSNARVAVIGAGALGNHVCLGLIGLGVGTIKIYDHDTVETHNLNRQSLFCEADIGENKAEALANRLEERNSSLIIIGIDEKIVEATIDDVLVNIDAVIDCVDLISVRRELSRFCIRNDIPLIHGGISWSGGEVGFLTRKTPCINCIYPKILQERELNEETSCTRKPEASVVYTAQIIAGIMVAYTRRALLPLKSDNPLPSPVLKCDLQLSQPFYYEPVVRLAKCECVTLLQKLAPKILTAEKKQKKMRERQQLADLQEFLSPESDS